MRLSFALVLVVGQQLGPYKVLAQIGAGGMGAVYRARDERLERDVAIKVLPPELARDEDRLRRFEAEARAAGALSDPHLVTIHEIGYADGVPYIVQELLSGETLRARLSGEALAPRTAVDLAIQIAHGIAAAHEKGIAHRDLKPENIVVTAGERIKIVDFGLAKLFADDPSGPNDPTRRMHTTPGSVMGTVGYMSPEQIRGQNVDHRTDIFSFGVVLFEMLTGRRPFEGATAADVTSAILREDPPDVSLADPAVSAAATRIVRRCLARDPAARFQSARDLAFALESIPAPSRAHPAAGTPRPRVRRGALAAAAALVLLAAAAAGAHYLSRRNATPPLAFEQLTFQRGVVGNARFGPDGRTVFVSAAWEGEPPRIYVKRPEAADLVALDGAEDAQLLSVSRTGELAVLLHPRRLIPYCVTGTLAVMPASGGAPRPLLHGVSAADWSVDGAALAVARDVGGEFRVELRATETAARSESRRPTVVFTTRSGYITNVRFSPDGEQLAITHHPRREATDVNITVVALPEGTRREIPMEDVGMVRTAWTAAGELWTGGGGKLHAFDERGRARVVASMPGEIGVEDLAPDGRLLVTTESWSQRVACLGAGQEIERDQTWLGWTRAMDMTADGRSILLQDYRPQRVFGTRVLPDAPIVRLGTARAHVLLPRREAVLTSRGAGFVLLPAGAGEEVVLRPHGFEIVNFAVSTPDESAIYFSATTGTTTHLYRQDVASGAVARISPDALFFGVIAVSPDGRQVAAVGPSRRITIYPTAGGPPVALTATVPGDQPIRFGADGALYYFSFPTLPTRIYRLDLGTGEKTLAREVAPYDRAGIIFAAPRVLTPDGRHYCYQYVQVASTLYLAQP